MRSASACGARDQDPHHAARKSAGMRRAQVEPGLPSEGGRIGGGAAAGHLDRLRAVRTQDEAAQRQALARELARGRRSACGRSRRAPSRKARSAASAAPVAGSSDRRERARAPRASPARIDDGDGALADGGQKIRRVEDRRDVLAQGRAGAGPPWRGAWHPPRRARALPSRVPTLPRSSVTRKVGPQAAHLRLPAQRRGADDRARAADRASARRDG